MREGAEVIYQGAFADGGWRGRADFLERVERPTGLGGWGYEAVDTKLSRAQALPHHVLQLSVYSQAIERIQGRAPEWMHLELGSGRRDTIRVADVAAYVRRAQAALRRAVDDPVRDRAVPVSALRDLWFRAAMHRSLARGGSPLGAWRVSDGARSSGCARRESATLEALGRPGGRRRGRRDPASRPSTGSATRRGSRCAAGTPGRSPGSARADRAGARARAAPRPERGGRVPRPGGRPLLEARAGADLPLRDRRPGRRRLALRGLLGPRRGGGARRAGGADRHAHRAARGRPGDARVPLQPGRALGPPADGGAARRARGRGGRPPARRGLRRPLHGRPPGLRGRATAATA